MLRGILLQADRRAAGLEQRLVEVGDDPGELILLVLEVAVQTVAIDAGADSEAEIKAAAEWIADNRDTIDPWIQAALAGG